MRLRQPVLPWVYCRATSGIGATITGTPATITYAAETDTHSGWSTNQYTIPISGRYNIRNANALTSLVWSTGTLATQLFVDGVADKILSFFNYATGSSATLSRPYCSGQTTKYFTAGQVLTFRTFQTQTGSTTLSGEAEYNWIEIELVSLK